MLGTHSLWMNTPIHDWWIPRCPPIFKSRRVVVRLQFSGKNLYEKSCGYIGMIGNLKNQELLSACRLHTPRL
jgi:hypothetical protein